MSKVNYNFSGYFTNQAKPDYQIFFSFLIFWTSCVLQFCQFIDANLFESRFHIIIFSVVLSPPSYHNNIIVEEASMLH